MKVRNAAGLDAADYTRFTKVNSALYKAPSMIEYSKYISDCVHSIAYSTDTIIMQLKHRSM